MPLFIRNTRSNFSPIFLFFLSSRSISLCFSYSSHNAVSQSVEISSPRFYLGVSVTFDLKTDEELLVDSHASSTIDLSSCHFVPRDE